MIQSLFVTEIRSIVRQTCQAACQQVETCGARIVCSEQFARIMKIEVSTFQELASSLRLQLLCLPNYHKRHNCQYSMLNELTIHDCDLPKICESDVPSVIV
jgi:hypothetical protein